MLAQKLNHHQTILVKPGLLSRVNRGFKLTLREKTKKKKKNVVDEPGCTVQEYGGCKQERRSETLVRQL